MEYVQYKNILFDIFEEFHCIMAKNKRTYYLMYGSLLGRIRDGRDIPWDPDADVTIPMKEAKKTVALLEKELSEDYYIVSDLTDSGYPNCFSRIGKRGCDISLLHLDIFYLIGLPKSNAQQYADKIYKLCKIRREKTYKDTWSYYSKAGVLKKLAGGLICYMKYGRYSLAAVQKQYDRLANRYDAGTSEKVANIDHADIFIFDNRLFGKPVLKKDVYGEYYAPSDSEGFLRYRYHDYHEYMNIEKRFDEVYFWLKAIRNTDTRK